MSRRKKKTGLHPGSIVYTGNKQVEKIPIHHLKYNHEICEDYQFDNQGEVVLSKSDDHIVDWYDIRGLHDTQLIQSIGEMYGIHPLALEDIADISQRPKFDEYDAGIYITMRALTFDAEKLNVNTEQISLYFRKGILFSFQESKSDLFEAVRKRIITGKGRIRQKSVDYLAYSILDVTVDHYYIIMEQIEEKMEQIEDDMLKEQDPRHKGQIHKLKKEIITMRKSIAPMREAVNQFSKVENPLVEAKTQVFVRDLYDHTIQIMDSVDSYRDLLNGLYDLFISEVSLKMNQVMQVLTIISAIFIPLSFLAGVYGMNFVNIPELQGHNNYFILVGVMVTIFIGQVWYFRKKKWLQ